MNAQMSISSGMTRPELVYERAQEKIKFRCFSHVLTVADVTFRWYLNGKMLTEQRGTHELEELPNGSQRLKVQSMQEIDGSVGLIACEILGSAATAPKVTSCFLEDSPVSAELSEFKFTTQVKRKEAETLSSGILITDVDNVTYVLDESTNAESAGTWDIFWMILITSSVVFVFGISIAVIVVVSRRCHSSQRAEIPKSSRNRHEAYELLPRAPYSANEPVYDLPRDEIGQPKELATIRYLSDVHFDTEDGYETNMCHPARPSTKEYTTSSGEDLYADVGEEPGNVGDGPDYCKCDVTTAPTNYENRRVVESTCGDSRSKYFRSKSGDGVFAGTRNSLGQSFSSESSSSSSPASEGIGHIYFQNVKC